MATTTTTTTRGKVSAADTQTVAHVQAARTAFASLREAETNAASKGLAATVPVYVTWCDAVAHVAADVLAACDKPHTVDAYNTPAGQTDIGAMVRAAIRHGVNVEGAAATAHDMLSDLSGRGKPEATRWSRAATMRKLHTRETFADYDAAYRTAGRRIDVGTYASYLNARDKGTLQADGTAPEGTRNTDTAPRATDAPTIVERAVESFGKGRDRKALNDVAKSFDFADLLSVNSRGKLTPDAVGRATTMVAALLARLALNDK